MYNLIVSTYLHCKIRHARADAISRSGGSKPLKYVLTRAHTHTYMSQRSAVAMFTFVGILDDGVPRGGVAATGQFLAVFRTVGIVFVVVFLI